MSAASATVPSAPIVSISAMGGGARGPPGSAHGAGTPGKCCENGRPVSTDPLTGQTICSCQYNPGALLMAASCYPRGVGMGVPGLADAASVYTSPYAAMQGLLPTAPGAEHAAFYSSMGALQGTAGYYAYDPFGGYPYGNGFAMDPNARRKNATRESTQTLKAWLSEHRKNPYPTKGEKIMLAIITKMTLTQVSTWFANARRRLKKENKMTWSPRNRCGDDDDLDNDDLDDDDTDNKLNGDVRDNDTNNNRDFADDTSENNDVDILDCDDRSLLDSDYSKSRTILGDDSAKDINVLDDDDSSAPSGNESSHEKVNTSLGSAFTLVSPSRVLGADHNSSRSSSPHSRSHPTSSLTHTDSERMRNGQHMLPKITSPITSPVTSQKPKIWSVADVMAKSSRDEDNDRARSPDLSPVHHTQMNGQHPPHPAFPSPPGSQNPSLSMARNMGLWSSSVTSLATGRYHPYGMGQGLFSMTSHPGGASAGIPTSRAHFPGHGLPSGLVPGLIGAPHPAGLGVPAGILTQSAMPTDLRKASPGSSSLGRTVDILGKSMTSPGDVNRSREGSPLVPTAFKPVARSS